MSAKRSKRYKAIVTKVDNNKKYSIDDAIKAAKETSSTKFDSSVDLTIVLNLKDKQKKESVKGTVSLPHIVGQAPVVVVIAELPEQKLAKAAGADEVGFEELITKIEKGWVDFDVLISTPKVMPKIAKLGKVIGSKGLMPNPKNDTVTNDVEKSVKSYKSGKTSYKMNEGGVINMRIAKSSMTEAQIKENYAEFMSNVNDVVKKFGETPFKTVTLKSSMGPLIKIDTATLFS